MDWSAELDKIATAAQHYPDIAVQLGASAFAQVLTLALEWWFLPTVTDPEAKRRQKGLTFLFCWTVSAVTGSVLWWLFDPLDPVAVRVTVSIIVGAVAFFAYPPLARIVTDKFPAVGSAWDGLKPKE